MSTLLPKQLIEQRPVNPKLGIKSSLAEMDELVFLTLLLWKINEDNPSLVYGEEVGNDLKIESTILTKVVDYFNAVPLSLLKESDSTPITVRTFTDVDLRPKIDKNPLYTKQFEPLLVSLSLFLKIANIKFTNPDFADSKERTGGRRYEKELKFSALIDVIDSIIECNVVEFKAICLNVIFKEDIKINDSFYLKIKKVLTVFSESTVFKLRDSSNERIFNQEGIYKVLLDGDDVIAKDFREDVGALRVLKSYISKNLHPYIDISGNKFNTKHGISTAELSSYNKRVETLLEINPVTHTFPPTIPTSSSIPTTPHPFGSYEFKNMLLKGVPGTGKSHTIDSIIKDKLKIIDAKNKLRINIHSASSNTDLLQGIGINSDEDGNIVYLEKQGIILNFIITAILNPEEPFVLVLEEIQENSLNELIGDLIYLLEESKRTNIKEITTRLGINIEDFNGEHQDLVDRIIELEPSIDYVQIPYLIESSAKFKNFILPDNLYLFCTSNYRDDKKVIEDNLLRRMATFEIFPKYRLELGVDFKDIETSNFLEDLNEQIIKQFEEREVHPDRFLIGHANWLKVETKEKFYQSLLKVIIEFQDIKELYFSDVKEILKGISKYPAFLDIDIVTKIKESKSYYSLVKLLQEQILR